MFKNPFIRFFILFLSILMVNVFLPPPETHATPNFSVSQEEAIGAALYQIVIDKKINIDTQWKNNIKVVSVDKVFDLMGNQLSYLVHLESNENNAGFIEVGVSKASPPIQSYSYTSDLSHLESLVENKNLLGEPQNQSNQRLVRLGPAHFAIQKDDTIIFNEDEYYIIKPEDYNVSQSNIMASSNDLGSSLDPLWEELNGFTGDIGSDSDGVTSNPMLFETGYSHATTSARSGVGDQNQITSSLWTGPSGCGPTSGYNVLYYWAYQNNMLDLIKNGNSVSVEHTIASLRTLMDTDNNGFGPVNKHTSAMIQHAKNKGFNNTTSTMTTNPSWSKVKSDMLTGPSLISLISQTFYGSHTVTGIGYIEFFYSGSSSGHEYMIVHDNWGSTPADVYVVYGRNYSTLYSVNFYPKK
ncbi:C39 family peptidase [Paenibacillus antibioticophila]|nr:C39 family peptidase [Paenibacillus antibioticophila]